MDYSLNLKDFFTPPARFELLDINLGYPIYSQQKNKKAPDFSSAFHSPNWTRTSDTLINSQVLYRLSYGGMHARTVLTNLNSSPAHAEEYFLWKIFFQSLSYRTYARTISNLF